MVPSSDVFLMGGLYAVCPGIKEYKDEDCVALRVVGLPYSFTEENVVSSLLFCASFW